MNILEIIGVTLIFLLGVLFWFMYCIRNAEVNESDNSILFVSKKDKIICKEREVMVGGIFCKDCDNFLSIETHNEISIVECKLKMDKIK